MLKTTEATVQSLHDDLAAIQSASLTMNDRFLAEAALISRELFLELMAKHACSLDNITTEHIIAELKQRSFNTYSIPAIPAVTGCG